MRSIESSIDSYVLSAPEEKPSLCDYCDYCCRIDDAVPVNRNIATTVRVLVCTHGEELRGIPRDGVCDE